MRVRVRGRKRRVLFLTGSFLFSGFPFFHRRGRRRLKLRREERDDANCERCAGGGGARSSSLFPVMNGDSGGRAPNSASPLLRARPRRAACALHRAPIVSFPQPTVRAAAVRRRHFPLAELAGLLKWRRVTVFLTTAVLSAASSFQILVRKFMSVLFIIT